MTRSESLRINAALPPLPGWQMVAVLPSDPKHLCADDVAFMFADVEDVILRDIARLSATHPAAGATTSTAGVDEPLAASAPRRSTSAKRHPHHPTQTALAVKAG